MWRRLAGWFRGGRRPAAAVPTQDALEPHPLDAPGDFYCARSVCLSCHAMDHVAGDTIGYEEDASPAPNAYGCYLKRQPKTEDELARLIEAMRYNDLEGLRYCGTDPDVLRRIAEAGQGRCCDRPRQS